MTTLLVIDTNVFVQFQQFDRLPWKVISGREDVILVVLAQVIGELDKLKTEPRLRDRVREVLRRLDTLFIDADVSQLEDGTPIRFEHGRELDDVIRRHGLSPTLGDDRILAAAAKLSESRADLVVVSDDVAVRLRARGLGLTACAVSDEFRRSETDPIQAENVKLKRELEQARLAMPRLELSFAEGGILQKFSRPVTAERRSDFLDRLGLVPLSLDALPNIYDFQRERPTEAEVQQYNEQLEIYVPKHERYLAERRAFELFPFRVVELDMVLKNDGGKPAEGIQLTFHLPDEIALVVDENRPREPAKPAKPRLPGRKRGLEALVTASVPVFASVFPSRSARLMPVSLSEPPPNVTGPTSARGELGYGIRLLSNFDEVALPQCTLCFPSPSDVRSFQMPYTIRSHNLPKLVEGVLHVVIAPLDAEAPSPEVVG